MVSTCGNWPVFRLLEFNLTPRCGKLLASAAIVSVIGLPSFASAATALPADFQTVAAQCAPGVHISTLAAVVSHESSGNPYAIGVNSKAMKLPRQPRSKTEAVRIAKRLLADGYNFDSGYGQINSKNLDWLGLSVDDLFDPCKNLAGSATVLTECYKRASSRRSGEQAALRAALSCYNTGDLQAGISNGYVQRVVAAANLDVPALLPVDSDGSAPVQLRSAPQRAHVQGDSSQPLPNSSTDAFSKSRDDAFVVFKKARTKQVDEKK